MVLLAAVPDGLLIRRAGTLNGAACISIDGGSGERISLDAAIVSGATLNANTACARREGVVFSHGES
jgi:hypothetical protein